MSSTGSRDEVVVVRLGGAVTRDRMVRSMVERRSGVTLWDLRSADLSALTLTELRELVYELYPVFSSGEGGRTAMLCDSDLAYGVCRVYGALQSLQGVPVEHAVFRDAEAALRWLDAA